MKDARVNPRWVDYRNPSNPHGLRFAEGEDGGTTPPTPTPPTGGAGKKGDTPPADAPKPTPPNPDAEKLPGGEDWESKFEGQRKVNRDLEDKFNSLRSGLAAALGVEGKKASTDDLVGALQQQVSQMQRANLVGAIARENEITKADDIALIEDAATEEGMRRIAARLKAASESTPGTPKPDRSQGGTGEIAPPESLPGVPRMAQAFEQEFAKSNH